MFSRIFKCNLFLISKLHDACKTSTIFALSSGFGKCGVAVVRISGPDSRQVLLRMAGFQDLPEPRTVKLRKLRNPQDKTILDHALVIWFPGPKSFTGEDCCELQIHGGRAVVASVLKSLSQFNNFRPADPGEFTKRAFYSNKLDLTEVEGLADLIEAETEAQRKQAVRQMEGALSRVYNSWRDSLTECVAKIEAFIDFSESDNLEEDLIEETKTFIEQLVQSIRKHLCDGRKGERLRDGVQTVILGAPNVGKSSLLNILCRKEEAIVSPIAGTTRDIVTSTIDIGGYPLIIKDTAGLRLRSKDVSVQDVNDSNVTSDPIEIEGISRALNAARNADLVLIVIEPCYLDPDKTMAQCIVNYCYKLGITEFLSLGVGKFVSHEEHLESIKKKCLLILNKADLLCHDEGLCNLFDAVISCKNEVGVDNLVTILSSNLETLCGLGDKEDALCNQVRHRHCLNEVVSSLETCLSTDEPDLIAHHVRQALYSLGKITGHVTSQQILDVIFKQFCVGK